MFFYDFHDDVDSLKRGSGDTRASSPTSSIEDDQDQCRNASIADLRWDIRPVSVSVLLDALQMCAVTEPTCTMS
jgi:hypothetical protein